MPTDCLKLVCRHAACSAARKKKKNLCFFKYQEATFLLNEYNIKAVVILSYAQT